MSISTLGPAYIYYPTDISDLAPESPLGGIDLPSDEFYQIHALSSRHPHPPRPGSPLNHLSGPLSNLGPKSPSKDMMAPSIYNMKSINC